jgi:hypothetical protein
MTASLLEDAARRLKSMAIVYIRGLAATRFPGQFPHRANGVGLLRLFFQA